VCLVWALAGVEVPFLVSVIHFVRFVEGRCANLDPLVVLSLSSTYILGGGGGGGEEHRAIAMKIFEASAVSVESNGGVWGGNVAEPDDGGDELDDGLEDDEDD